MIATTRTYADVLAMANGLEAVAKPRDNPQPTVIEADDDPHRLARVNLERYATRKNGRTLRFWRDEWYVWKGRSYSRITERELKAKLSQSVKEEFNRLNIEQQQNSDAEDQDKEAKKVTQSLVSNVIQATSGMVVIGSSVELMTWLPTRERRNYVSMANGILDLDALIDDREDYLLPQSPEWFSTASLPFRFDPAAKCDQWLGFLRHNLEEDQERISVLQEWAGYLLLPDTGQQRFLLMEGEGSNGKSVFMAAITAMMGRENVSNVSLENFGDRFSRTDTLGKLANIAGDCEELDKVAEGYIKSFTSGDRMYFDRKGISGINCIPTARLMISCNERPRFKDRSQGIWRRMLLIPWRKSIEKAMRIKNMDKPAWWEASGELPGILNWAIVGLQRLQEKGDFTASVVSSEAVSDYQKEMNSARAFLTELVAKVEDGGDPYHPDFLRVDFLYSTYMRWARAGNQHPFSKPTFAKEMFRVFKGIKRSQFREAGTKEDDTRHRHWVYRGIEFTCDVICGEKISDPVSLVQDL